MFVTTIDSTNNIILKLLETVAVYMNETIRILNFHRQHRNVNVLGLYTGHVVFFVHSYKVIHAGMVYSTSITFYYEVSAAIVHYVVKLIVICCINQFLC